MIFNISFLSKNGHISQCYFLGWFSNEKSSPRWSCAENMTDGFKCFMTSFENLGLDPVGKIGI